MNYIKGKTASSGIAFGVVHKYVKTPMVIPAERKGTLQEEQKRIKDALVIATEELRELMHRVEGKMGDDLAHIFRAQLTMSEDEDFITTVLENLALESMSAEQALKAACEEYTQLFGELGDDDYNKQRLSDLHDVCDRLLRILLGVSQVTLSKIPEHSIIFADELLPSDTVEMDKGHIEGIVVRKGGVTSHVAILAKTLGFPASVGTDINLDTIKDGQQVVLDARDADDAIICLEPDATTTEKYRQEYEHYLRNQKQLQKMRGLSAVTKDGKTIQLSANVGSSDDLRLVRKLQVSSIGLLRTEFFFLESSQLPSEEQQFAFYRDAALATPNLVVVRTLDIGGDKQIPSYPLNREDNPFLGLRGVRFSLRHQDIFKTQLRAIMRAAVYGNVCIMIPMVADVSELRQVQALCATCAEELEREHIPFSRHIKLGLMAETPASVLLADILSEEGDFVSIGTNDLTQYLVTADRNNAEVSKYYRIYSPAVFRAIHTICEKVHEQGKWVGLCGELGGNLKVIPALIGLGVDELSMSARTVAAATLLIRSLSYQACQNLAKQVLQCRTEEDVETCLAEFAGSM